MRLAPFNVNGTQINTLLNAGTWTLTPNQLPVSGTFDIKLHERGHTNFASSQNAYTVLDRSSSAGAWGHQGNTIGMTQTWSANTVAVPKFGLSSFGDFGIGFGNTVLPVTLTSFTATAVERRTVLDWKTESEYNNDYFDVQRSFDGTTFDLIGNVDGNGTTTEAHEYRFTDNNPVNGVNYYRLKQVDFDGTEHFSNIALVKFDFVQSADISFRPNPALDVLYVSGLKENAVVNIYNVTGKIILSYTADENGEGMIDVRGLSSGSYIIRVFQNDGSKWWSDKFIKSN